MVINGTVTFDFWSGMKSFLLSTNGDVTVYLRDYNGSSHTEIGNGNLVDADWQGGSTTWVNKTIDIAGLDYTIPAGNELEVKIIVGIGAGNDMWFSYATTSYDTFIQIP